MMDKLRINKINILKVEYLLLLLISMGFLDASNVLVIALLGVTLYKMIIRNDSIFINKEFITLLLFSCAYFGIYSLTNNQILVNLVYYLIGPVGMYVVGGQLIDSNKDGNRKLMSIIMIIGMGYFIHGALNIYSNITTNYLQYSTESILDFWSNSPILRTLQGLYYTTISSLLFNALFVKEKNYRFYLRFLIVVSSIFSICSTFTLGSRTLIFIVLITFFSTGIVYLILTKKRSSFLNKILLVISLLYLILILDIGNIRTSLMESILESNLILRFGGVNASIVDSSRWDFYKEFLETFYLYPFGINLAGNHIINFLYAHNLWIDVYVQVGFIPFLLLVIYSISILKDLYSLMINMNATISVKLCLFSVYIGILANFMVEPIIQADIYFFMTFCLLNGAVKRFIIVKKFEKQVF